MDLFMTRGASATWNIPVTLSGEPDPLDGATLVFTAKYDKADADADAAIVKSSADGIVVLNAQEGTAQLQLDPADTTTLPPDQSSLLDWDIWFFKGGESYQIASGSLLVRASVRSFDA